MKKIKKIKREKSQYDGCSPQSVSLFIQRVKLTAKEIYVKLLTRLDGTGGMLLLQSLVSPSRVLAIFMMSEIGQCDCGSAGVLKTCIAAQWCVCVRTPGSDPSLGRRVWGEVLLINPNFLRSRSFGPPAALRSRAFTQNCLTKISGLGQTARLIRGDSMRQTTQTYSPPPNLFS